MTTTQGQQGPVGQLVDGRYLIVGKIAEGGMASVYQARDQRLDRQVALKIMHAQLAQGPHAQEYIERFHREARSAAAVSNPHIVPVYDTGTYDGRSYLIMELIQGVTLRQELDSRKTFSVHETLVILTQILEGLAAAHEARVIHRDIKPENIMITRQGQIKITDFGLAKATSQKTLSATGMLLGTASYLAPEMIEDNISSPYMAKVRVLVSAERERVRNALQARGIDAHGHANFLFFQLDDDGNLARKLIAKGILIRDCANFYGLAPGAYRIAVLTKEKNNALLRAIDDIYAGTRGDCV